MAGTIRLLTISRNSIQINENATLLFSISFHYALVNQNFVLITLLYWTFSIVSKSSRKSAVSLKLRAPKDKQSLFYNKLSIFAIFSKTSTQWWYFENAIIFIFPNNTSWQNIEKLTLILLYSAAVWLKKIDQFSSIFQRWCSQYIVYLFMF